MAEHVVSRKILAIVCVVAVLLPGIAFAQDSDEERENADKMGNLLVVVTGVDEDGSGEATERPIKGATVFVNWTDGNEELEWDATANNDGRAKLIEVRRGELKIQVIATGWKRFGLKYQLKNQNETIQIRLEKKKIPQ